MPARKPDQTAADDGPVIVWFRHDLRLADNPALAAALTRKGPIIPVFVWSPDEETPWQPGAASRWWLHHALAALAEALAGHGSRLVLRVGPVKEALLDVARATSATAVYWSRRYEPALRARDRQVRDAMLGAGFAVKSFNAGLLVEPWEVQTAAGRPFQVYSAFARAVDSRLPALAAAPPARVPRQLPAPGRWPRSEPLEALALLPHIDWAGGLRTRWHPGERAARARLAAFVRERVAGYDEGRDVPGEELTSGLSPHLHFGEIGPRQVLQAVSRLAPGAGTRTFVRELLWREFAHHLLYHYPQTPDRPLRAAYARFPWVKLDAGGRNLLRAWQRGRTGFPLVDAGMRELWQTGWMHNRVRMVVGSFLVKDLLLPWQEGARWFWDTLVDADLANNTLGWQWVAGCGADAAPYFRVFNPVSQARKFDAGGHYVRTFVPELGRLPDRHLFEPWTAPPDVLAAAGVVLDGNYPNPIVDHGWARERALAAWKTVQASRA